MEQEAIKTDFPEYKTVSISELVPYARNSRTHSDAQIEQIAKSIREFGFLNPIIVDGDKGIIAGHGRVLAARHLGLESLPCIEASHLTEAQRRAYVLADNKLAINAGWNNDLLRVELGDLRDMGFDIELTGFDIGEIAGIFLDREDGATDADAEWQGMPEFDQDDKTSWRCINVHFACADDLAHFGRLIGQKLTEKTRSIWHPKAEIERYADKTY